MFQNLIKFDPLSVPNWDPSRLVVKGIFLVLSSCLAVADSNFNRLTFDFDDSLFVDIVIVNSESVMFMLYHWNEDYFGFCHGFFQGPVAAVFFHGSASDPCRCGQHFHGRSQETCSGF